MLKPSVGDIVSMGSPLNRFNIVVLPALSKPNMRILISFSFCRNFFNIVRKPIVSNYWLLQNIYLFYFKITSVCLCLGVMRHLQMILWPIAQSLLKTSCTETRMPQTFG
ncbi:unnamed protein product [Spodoptera exigua]|nr:unnamed protein product [Spodoptera exigua]